MNRVWHDTAIDALWGMFFLACILVILAIGAGLV